MYLNTGLGAVPDPRAVRQGTRVIPLPLVGRRGMRGLGATPPAVYPDPGGPTASYGSWPDLDYYLKHSLSHQFEGSFAGAYPSLDGTLDLSTVDQDAVVSSFIHGAVGLCDQQRYNKVIFGYPVDPACGPVLSDSSPGPAVTQFANQLRQWLGAWAAWQQSDKNAGGSGPQPGIVNFPLVPCGSNSGTTWGNYCKGGVRAPLVAAVPVVATPVADSGPGPLNPIDANPPTGTFTWRSNDPGPILPPPPTPGGVVTPPYVAPSSTSALTSFLTSSFEIGGYQVPAWLVAAAVAGGLWLALRPSGGK